MDIKNFIQDEIFKMQFLNDALSNFFIYLGLDKNSQIYKIALFFFYDIIKISIFLVVLVFITSLIQSYFDPKKVKNTLSKVKGIRANLIAALFGVITPFCSCSSIPLFIGLKNAGVNNGVAFSFLISSPMTDLAAIAILSSVFGIKTTFIYIVFGLFVAVIGGVIIQKINFSDNMQNKIYNKQENKSACCCKKESKKISKIKFALNQTIKTYKGVILFIIIGVGIGAFIHNSVPTSVIEKILGSKNGFSVILATIVGVPIYAEDFAIIPIAQNLLAKGAGLGTTLAFMMGATIVSLPSLIMLSKAINLKLLGVFLAIVMTSTIVLGYFFNFFQGYFLIKEGYLF